MNKTELKTIIAISIGNLNLDNLEDSELNKNIDAIYEIVKAMNPDLTDEMYEEVKREIKSEYSVKMTKGVSIKEEYKKWFLDRKASLDMKYWMRYKTYLTEKGFAINVINKMDDILDEITDLLGDPISKSNFQRRGLVIGDVQSGKTSNYIGLMCKAADAKYKVFVLLTGTIEKLREQTQRRIEEGFIGLRSDKDSKLENSFIGVGKIDSSVTPISLTSIQSDFSTNSATSCKCNVENTVTPLVFVIKKNVTTLKQLNKWLKFYNLNGKEKIEASLLMIDDEADNASINTNKEDEDPTAINAQIKEMLNMFTKASYVGFTATPFANIFIDPNRDNLMEKEDIFPKDYIYYLDAPTNYIGVRDIFGENAKYSNMLKLLEDDELEKNISLKMKKDDTVVNIPESMKDAIIAFFIANVIRDLRGQSDTHRSMMINVNRYTNIHRQIEGIVNNFTKELKNSIRLYGKIEDDIALKDENMNRIKNVYEKHYSNLEFKWDRIKEYLLRSTEPIKVISVNSENKNKLNYNNEKIRVIAIGGFSLSRGLTLEGLMTTYVYGNTRMYDTLLQKGRWFGYRKGYEDVCSIWMTEKTIKWYKEVSEALDELKLDVRRMEIEGKKPLDFGLKIRCSLDTLDITARNKMRTAKSFSRNVSLNEVVIETPYINTSQIVNINNKRAVDILINKLGGRLYKDEETNRIGFKNVDKDTIIEFLEKFEVSNYNYKYNAKAIINFINNYKGNELEKWDIAIPTGESNEFLNDYGLPINMISRKCDYINEGEIARMSGINNRLGSSSDARFGLTKEKIIEHTNKIIKLSRETDKPKNNLSEVDYFKMIKRNPLLIIYFVKTKDQVVKESDYLLGIAIGIPTLTDTKTIYAKYKVNIVGQEQILFDNSNMMDEWIEEEG